MDFDVADITFANEQVRSGNHSASLAEAPGDGMVAEDSTEYGDLGKKYQQSTFGARFAEVGVNIATGEPRVRRMLAVCAARRIPNPTTARTQVIGMMTDGWCGAHRRDGRPQEARFFRQHDLADYEAAVHTDVPHKKVIFLQQTDPISLPMKAKGLGEFGLYAEDIRQWHSNERKRYFSFPEFKWILASVTYCLPRLIMYCSSHLQFQRHLYGHYYLKPVPRENCKEWQASRQMTTIVCSTAAHTHFGGLDVRQVAAKFHLATAICRPIFQRGQWRARQCITIALQYRSFTPRLHGSF